jgi:hypothetical protein
MSANGRGRETKNYRPGDRIELVGPAGLADTVPMVSAPGCCGITVSEIKLSHEGVVIALAGLWRASFGAAAASAGDVVLELLEPPRRPIRRPLAPAGREADSPEVIEEEPRQVAIRLLVAAHDVRPTRRHSPAPTAKPPAFAHGPVHNAPGQASWLWLGSWPTVGPQWPFLVGPLVFIAWEQERHAAIRAT